MDSSLSEGYEIRELETDAFGMLWEEPAKLFFDDVAPVFRVREILNDTQTEQVRVLGERLKDRYRLNLGLFHREEFVGWSWGFQDSADTYYMCNSAVFPEHRRKGLYTALLNATLERVTEMGFQRIYGRHVATNNPVIIAKLKAGFQITQFELSDAFGALVHLTWYPHELRRRVLSYRSGQVRPDGEIRRLLRFP